MFLHQEKCAQTVGYFCGPYSVWCSTDPSVIRVEKSTNTLYHGAKNASRKQITNNFRILKRFHVKVDKMPEYTVKKHKNTGGSDNHPNITSISQPLHNVNRKMNKVTKICIMRKHKLCDLYNIPYCKIRKLCYYITTKR